MGFADNVHKHAMLRQTVLSRKALQTIQAQGQTDIDAIRAEAYQQGLSAGFQEGWRQGWQRGWQDATTQNQRQE